MLQPPGGSSLIAGHASAAGASSSAATLLQAADAPAVREQVDGLLLRTQLASQVELSVDLQGSSPFCG